MVVPHFTGSCILLLSFSHLLSMVLVVCFWCLVDFLGRKREPWSRKWRSGGSAQLNSAGRVPQADWTGKELMGEGLKLVVPALHPMQASTGKQDTLGGCRKLLRMTRQVQSQTMDTFILKRSSLFWCVRYNNMRVLKKPGPGPHQRSNFPAPWSWTSQSSELWQTNLAAAMMD